MNKKGAVLHWVVVGVYAAMILFFFLLSQIGGLDEDYRGEWQADFLEHYYQNAEEDLLRVDYLARVAGRETALELGLLGGFVGEGECGVVESYNLWNDGEKNCYPLMGQMEERVGLMVKGKLDGYSEIWFSGSELIGKGSLRAIKSDRWTEYTYDSSFRVDLGYNFSEYEDLWVEASDLVAECQGEGDLKGCLERKKEKNWKFKDCREEYVSFARQVPFCVEGSAVYVEGVMVPVRYLFGLDFS